MASERPDRAEALIDAGLALASELSLPAVLERIVQLACNVAEARYGALGVLDPTGRISQFITHGLSEEERARIGALPVGKGILGALIVDAEPLRLARISDDPRSVGFPPNHPPMDSFLGVPISVRGTVYGNLYLTEKRGAEGFTDDDERAVVTLATQAAVALENARLYEEAEIQRRRLEAVNEITGSMLAGSSPETVLALTARHARELVGADLASIAIPSGDGLRIAAADGHRADQLQGAQFASEGSISAVVMEERQPLAVEDARLDPRVSQPVVALGGIGPALFVPLGGTDRALGTLTVANRAGGQRFGEEHLSLTQVFAAQAAVAVDYARLREELQRLAVLEDRERIAKELHDGVVQSLFAVGMSLQAAESVGELSAPVRERMSAAVEDIDRVIRELRNYIFGLRPRAAADQGPIPALQELVADFRRGTDLAIRAELDPTAASLVAPKTNDLVQVTREAISNASRHAEASTLSVTLQVKGSEILLEIEDDGKGFDPSQVQRGHGLTNLEARAEAIGGRLEIESIPGSGTRIRLRIPA